MNYLKNLFLSCLTLGAISASVTTYHEELLIIIIKGLSA
jgi:hypothetical protein